VSKEHARLLRIIECIDNIEFILNDNSLKITQAIEDKLIKPAIRMNIVRISEQFAKLKDDNAFEILEHFSKDDLRGISAVRNYIAHDYDSTDDFIIDEVVRYNLPVLKHVILEILHSDKA
jgi:uncharacterized protein with HEPN domain